MIFTEAWYSKMFEWINRDITKRFAVLFLLGCTIPALVVGSVLFYKTRAQLETDTQRELANIVSLKREWLETWIMERERSLEDLSNSISHFFHFKNEFQIKNALSQFLSNNPDFLEFSLISWPEGHVEISTDIESEGRLLSNREYFKRAIAYSGVQPIFYSVHRGEVGLVFVEPIRDETGRVIYLLVGRARMEKITEILSLMVLERGENSYLINRYGAFMIMIDHIEMENVVTSPAMHASIRDRSVGGKYVNSKGEEVVGYCSYIEDLDAVLVSEIEFKDLMKPQITLMWRVTAVIFIGIIIGFAIFYLLLKKSLRPIQTLTTAAEAAAGGDMSIRVRTEGQDQITKLANNFNYMTSRLEESIRELKAVEEKERRLIEKANDAFLITDELGNILRTNPRALELWGYNEREVQDMSVFEFFTEQSAKDFGRFFREISKKRSGNVIELNALKSNKQTFAVDINSIALGDGTYLSIIRDMSEKRKLEQELIHAQKLESVGTLAAGIAHDFDNILVGVLGAASYLKSLEGFGETETEMLNVIEESAERAAGLVKQLMTFARQDTPNREQTSIDDLIEDVVRLLSKGLGEDIELIVRRSEELPVVYIDPIQIKQTLFNICLNGRDAMPEGGELSVDVNSVELDQLFVQTHPNLRVGKYVQISISDNGVGISEDQMARIFEPFYTTKPAGTGTGLGLAVSYGIIEAHGGTITVDSQPGFGTAFHIFLPAHIPGKTADEPEKPCILVVTKDSTSLKLLKLALGSKQYQSVFSSGIIEAQGIPGIRDRIELVFVGIEVLDDDPSSTLKEIRSYCDKAGVYILGELPGRISMSIVDGSVRDRYDVTSIIAIVRRYMGFGKSSR